MRRLKKGDIVQAKAYIETQRYEFDSPIKAMFLGWGTLHKNECESTTDSELELITVAVITPHPNGNLYNGLHCILKEDLII